MKVDITCTTETCIHLHLTFSAGNKFRSQGSVIIMVDEENGTLTQEQIALVQVIAMDTVRQSQKEEENSLLFEKRLHERLNHLTFLQHGIKIIVLGWEYSTSGVLMLN